MQVATGFDRIDRDDVRMGERPSRTGLALEPHPPRGIGRDHEFERDVAVQEQVAGAIDLAHAARAERAEDLVVAERLPGNGTGGRERRVLQELVVRRRESEQ